MAEGTTRHPAADSYAPPIYASWSGGKSSSRTSSQTLSSSEDDGQLTPNSQDSALFKMADAASILTLGCIARAAENQLPQGEEVIVQCVQVKTMGNPSNPQPNAPERYRVVVNDSINFMQGMLGQQLNYLVHENKLRRGVMLRLKNFSSNFVKDKIILVLLDLEILEEYGELEKIGQPVAYEPQKAEGAEDTKPQPGNIAGNNFYGNKPQAQQQQQRSLPSRTNGTSGGGQGSIYPIEALSPYAHKWTIKARCTHKGDIKTWHNKNGEGKLFSVNFLDDSGEIRATGFNDAVDTWYEVLQEGSVYYISAPCRVQLAKKQFSNVNNDYELTFEKDTVIEKAEDAEGVPQVSFNFTTLADLQTVEKDSTIDCIGVLTNVDEVSEIVSKTTSKPYQKRELTLVDNTGFSVRLTVWGKTAESFEARPESVIAFKGVKVSDFNGRSLSLLSSGSMTLDPDIEQAYNLKGWYDGSGRNEQFQSHATTMPMANATSGGDRNATKTIAQVAAEKIGFGDEVEWFSVKATIIYIKQENFAYPACETCNKKVIAEDGGTWRCEKCSVSHDRPVYRYVLSVNVSDHTGQIWLSCFNETGEQIMGMTANDLIMLKDDEGDDRKLRVTFDEATCKTFIFRCKAKLETFGDDSKVRYQVQYAKALDYVAEAKKLTDIIEKYTINESSSLFVS